MADSTIDSPPDPAIAALPPRFAKYGNTTLTQNKYYNVSHSGLEKKLPLDHGHLAQAAVPEADTSTNNEHTHKRQKTNTEGDKNANASEAQTPGLGALPIEVLAMIFVYLDIPTLIDIRRASRRCMAGVDAIRAYRVMRRHCPDILRAIVAVQARSYDLQTLWATLHTAPCDSCNGSQPWMFGGDHGQRLAYMLYLVTCRRVCFVCQTTQHDFYPLTVGQATKAGGVTKSKLTKAMAAPNQSQSANNFPYIRTIGGQYGPFKKWTTDRTVLLDRAAVQPGLVPKQDQTSQNVKRYQAIVNAPYFPSLPSSASTSVESTGIIDWGFHCQKCIDVLGNGMSKRVMYTRDGLIQHVKTFQHVGGQPAMSDDDDDGGESKVE